MTKINKTYRQIAQSFVPAQIVFRGAWNKEAHSSAEAVSAAPKLSPDQECAALQERLTGLQALNNQRKEAVKKTCVEANPDAVNMAAQQMPQLAQYVLPKPSTELPRYQLPGQEGKKLSAIEEPNTNNQVDIGDTTVGNNTRVRAGGLRRLEE